MTKKLFGSLVFRFLVTEDHAMNVKGKEDKKKERKEGQTVVESIDNG